MGRAIAVRTDYRSGDIRRIAQRVKNAAQARRLLAIATVLDGAARQEAAKIGGMDRQTLRDWVIRFNEQGPDGLINKVSPGAPGKLTNEHKAFLARLVEDGPIPATRRRRALEGLRSDHAAPPGVRHLGLGRYGLSQLEGPGLLACQCQAQGLQAEC